MNSYLELEDLLAERLAGVPGLSGVESLTDVDERTFQEVDGFTAVTAFLGDERKDSNPSALLREARWGVSLVVRSDGTTKRQEGEGDVLLAIVRALHGWCPGEAFGTLELQSMTPDSDDRGSVRWYAMVFSVDTTIYV
jgi:hypothetical protein